MKVVLCISIVSDKKKYSVHDSNFKLQVHSLQTKKVRHAYNYSLSQMPFYKSVQTKRRYHVTNF